MWHVFLVSWRAITVVVLLALRSLFHYCCYMTSITLRDLSFDMNITLFDEFNIGAYVHAWRSATCMFACVALFVTCISRNITSLQRRSATCHSVTWRYFNDAQRLVIWHECFVVCRVEYWYLSLLTCDKTSTTLCDLSFDTNFLLFDELNNCGHVQSSYKWLQQRSATCHLRRVSCCLLSSSIVDWRVMLLSHVISCWWRAVTWRQSCRHVTTS